MAKRKENRLAEGSRCMPMEQLRVFGDPTLKQQTHEVIEFGARLHALSELMFDVMEREGGVGLAAPQIGMLSRVMVWKNSDDEDAPYTFVNPRVTLCSEATVTDEEGCLSVPGVVMQVTRAEEVTVEFQDLEGDTYEVHLAGFPARVVQHEIDHLDGCLIIDRTSLEERRRVLKELRERSLEAGT
jgi:peptide deformylase